MMKIKGHCTDGVGGFEIIHVDKLEIDGIPYVPPPAPSPRVWSVEVGLYAPDKEKVGRPWAHTFDEGSLGHRAVVTLEFTDRRAWVKPTKADKDLAAYLRVIARQGQDEAIGVDPQHLREAADRLDGGQKG